MVAHRSPKPPVRVRVLLPLPQEKQIGSICFFYFIIFYGGDFYIFNFFNRNLIIIFVITLLICIFFIPVLNSNGFSTSSSLDSEIIDLNPDGFVWPIPGYTRISSYFGKRVSPTSGASSSHSGIDIPAPGGSKFIAVADGEITFCKFLGAGGYTITLSFDNFKVSYCHCDPDFIVKVGDKVKQGQVIRLCWS